MGIESRLGRTLPILMLSPPRERNEPDALPPGLAAHLSRRFVPVHFRHPEVE
jgi:hypothetical protein